MQWSVGPFKNVTSDKLDETLYTPSDLSSQCAAVTLLMSLISLLTTLERDQETGAGRVLLSVTSPAGVDQQLRSAVSTVAPGAAYNKSQ